MQTPRPTNVVRRLESARSATELTASVLSVTLQLLTMAALARPALRTFTRRRTCVK
jgi:type III secretory pathway component EscU